MRFSQIEWTNPAIILPLSLIGLCAVAAIIWPAWALFALVLALVPLIRMIAWVSRTARFLDARIDAVLPEARGWQIHVKSFPIYKAVDIIRAARGLLPPGPRCVLLEAECHEPLSLLFMLRRGTPDRQIRQPTRIARADGPESETYLPSDAFWLARAGGASGRGPCVVRVRLMPQAAQVLIEVAAPRAAAAEQLLDDLLAQAAGQSIYRGHALRVTFGRTIRSDYDDEDVVAPMDLTFLREAPVTEEAIVLEPAIRRTLEHTVVDFHHRREALMRLGVPGKRGVLFYGPPGTGKTYTCRYLANRLAPVTTLVATGHALLRMQEICALAGMFQPALVLLEDVDLVFASRELNAYNTVLGEFMDALDGFGEEQHVIFVLTTNAIERVEAAIKDRPGRISQCIYFGPPGPALRRRYLEQQLRAYPGARCDLGPVVAQTEGVSQAFLKELVYRSVQIASAEQAALEPGAVRIDDGHIGAALEEMLDGAGQAGRRIIGFRIDA